MKEKFKLEEGEHFNKNPKEPVIIITGKGKQTFLWIGNDAESDTFCFATIAGTNALRTLANNILKALANE